MLSPFFVLLMCLRVETVNDAFLRSEFPTMARYL